MDDKENLPDDHESQIFEPQEWFINFFNTNVKKNDIEFVEKCLNANSVHENDLANTDFSGNCSDNTDSPVKSIIEIETSENDSEWENYEDFEKIHLQNSIFNNHVTVDDYVDSDDMDEFLNLFNSEENQFNGVFKDKSLNFLKSKKRNIQLDASENNAAILNSKASVSNNYDESRSNGEFQFSKDMPNYQKKRKITFEIPEDRESILNRETITSSLSNNYQDSSVPQEYCFENPEFGELIYNGAYAEYEPTKLKIGKRHPYAVVESRSLTTMEAPDIRYKLEMNAEIVERAILSNVQLEALSYACQKHEEFLSDGRRAGFLIGDGAGVGKGRTVAGIVFENYFQGRKKAVWISVSSDLVEDARRDLRDIGREIDIEIEVKSLNKMSYEKIDSNANGNFKIGVLFTTYSSLISQSQKKGRNLFNRRLDQIIDWFGVEYDGVIIFDESHKAKNLTGRNVTKCGMVVKELQDTVRAARVVYASATGATEPRHLAYMVRLGLWGPNKPFEEFDEFNRTLTRHGVAAMELMAIEMKMQGVYLARQLSFQGVEFEIREMRVATARINGFRFEEVYNRSVLVWTSCYREFSAALKRNKYPGKIENIFMAQFWGAHQRFFKYLCMSAKVEECVRLANQQIGLGKCVVIGLQSTGEARTAGELEEAAGEVLDFVSSAKGVVKNLIRNFYPSAENLARFRLTAGDKKKSKKKTSLEIEIDIELDKSDEEDCSEFDEDSENSDVENSPDATIQRKLLRAVKEMEGMLPVNVLDHLIDGLGGPDAVAEMTGRKGRMVRDGGGGVAYQGRREAGHSLDQMNILEKNRFNSGQKLVGIISDAASTGISLHSDKRFKNKRQRVHITLELPWSADKAVQQFGRTHRSNQISPPHYIFLISDLAGEKRFAATVAKRLESLGALTHGDRRCADSADLSQFNLDNAFGSKAVREIAESLIRCAPPPAPFPREHMRKYENNPSVFRQLAADSLRNVGLDEIKSLTVSRFLNRILGIKLDIQNCLFQYFLDVVELKMQLAKERNEFDHGIRDVKGKKDLFYIEETRVLRYKGKDFTNEDIGNENRSNNDIIIHKLKHVDIGVCWDTAAEIYNRNTEKNRFCVSKKGAYKILALAEYYEKGKFRLVTIQFPPKLIDENSLRTMYDGIGFHEARSKWTNIYEESEKRCLHHIDRGECNRENCVYGKRTKYNYIITGSVFLAWKLISAVYQNLKMQIIRVETQDGTKLIGALVSFGYFRAFMNSLLKKCVEIKLDSFVGPDFVD